MCRAILRLLSAPILMFASVAFSPAAALGADESSADGSSFEAFASAPTWSDWSDLTSNPAAARCAAIPSTAAVAPESVVMHGISRRSAAVRMWASSSNDSRPIGVLTIRWMSPLIR